MLQEIPDRVLPRLIILLFFFKVLAGKKLATYKDYATIDNAPQERERGITINACHLEYATENRSEKCLKNIYITSSGYAISQNFCVFLLRFN